MTMAAPQDHPELGHDPLAARLSKTFTSARLVYRGIEMDDAEFLYRIKSDPESAINASAGWPRPFTHDAAKDFMKIFEKNVISVVVELPEDRTPIGLVCLWNVYGSDPTPSRLAEMGVDILAPYQGHGYGSEAIRWVLDWAFEMAGLHRIRLHVFSWNTKAIRAYERVGFERAGVEREATWCAGRWWDLLTYGILDREWQQIKERKGLVHRDPAGN
jgi:RimJ/RimL family protein N-acetyltransferase